MTNHLSVGGLVAAGFDSTGKFLLTVSHAGRGVFAVGSWERVARDLALAYPDNGSAIGIGPIAGQVIAVIENYGGPLDLKSPDGSFRLSYDSGTITVTSAD